MTPSTGMQYSPAVNLELARRLSAASQRSASRCSILARSDMYFLAGCVSGNRRGEQADAKAGSLGGPWWFFFHSAASVNSLAQNHDRRAEDHHRRASFP